MTSEKEFRDGRVINNQVKKETKEIKRIRKLTSAYLTNGNTIGEAPRRDDARLQTESATTGQQLWHHNGENQPWVNHHLLDCITADLDTSGLGSLNGFASLYQQMEETETLTVLSLA